MTRFRRKEYSVPAAFAAGILLLAVIQVVSALFMEEGLFTAVYRRVLGAKPVETATSTPEIAPLPDRSRAFAVMIDNHPNALPQSGVNEAAIVWEALVEGGLTRYMAVYRSSTDAPEIGPVRSARPYFLDWASESGAVYAHVGGSDEALGILAAKKLGLDDANEFSNGATFWRDETRSAPHNTYTSIARLKALAEKKGWALESDAVDATIRSDLFVEDASSAAIVSIAFARGGQAAEFRHDQAAGSYRRYVNGRAARDRANRPIATANVVAIELDAVPGKDPQGKGLQAMKTAGSGRAVVFRGGRAAEGTWRKGSPEAPLEVFGADGKKIPFAFGQVWYAVIAPNKGGSVDYR